MCKQEGGLKGYLESQLLNDIPQLLLVFGNTSIMENCQQKLTVGLINKLNKFPSYKIESIHDLVVFIDNGTFLQRTWLLLTGSSELRSICVILYIVFRALLFHGVTLHVGLFGIREQSLDNLYLIRHLHKWKIPYFVDDSSSSSSDPPSAPDKLADGSACPN